ncbi:hypothetical protein HDU84_003682 [Entophlyctis sp. JEL0112]|nr:hypothetical protein HDU84_003682 [Entophlyctis sp. JEL0112]
MKKVFLAAQQKDMDLRKRKKAESSGLPFVDRTTDSRYTKIPRSAASPTFGDVGLLPDLRIMGALTVFAILVRLFRISNPHEVVFDEVHFGGFATKYINGNFFMDVHPPLGKLLFAAAGLIGGYNSTFYFENIGDDYLASHAPYVFMRLLPGLMGVGLVPIAYMTLRNFGMSNVSSVLSALMLCLENGFITQSRLILLDSGLVFFTGLTVMMWSDFLTSQSEPFTLNWWYPLAMTGVCLGLAGSVKWVGLFLIATIGLSTLHNLWTVLGDLRVSARRYMDHFMARFLCLLVIPGVIYAFLFQVHFWALPNSGSGTGFMSPEFQSTLKGRAVSDTFEDVAFGSIVHIRHHETNGGYLHSHKHNYPEGSKQQQITVYPFRDENGAFRIKYGLAVVNGTLIERKVERLDLLRNGDIIRLEHVQTGKHLHSHDVRAPVTKNEHHWEVSGYGDPKWLGDTNDNWIVRLADPTIDKSDRRPIKAMNMHIRLIHVNNRQCGLFSHDKKLPSWAFEQQEVTCSENNVRAGAIWLFESNENSLLPPNSKKVNFKRPGFWRKFIELHGTMWSVNSGLTSKHPYESRPIDWPVLNRGILFWTEKNNGPRQIYLIGNPIVWWVSTFSVLFSAALLLAGVLLLKRQIPFLNELVLYKGWHSLLILFPAWFLHYIPFFFMKRQLFLHHYFPALYFAILTVGVIFEIFTHQLSRPSRIILAGGFLALVFIVYLDFSPLAYGNLMHKHHCERIKWGKHWDWTCFKSPEDKHELPAQIGGRLLHAIEHIKDAFPNHSGSISVSIVEAKVTGTATAAALLLNQPHKGPAVVPQLPTTTGAPKVIAPNLALPLRGGLLVDSRVPADVPERGSDLAGAAEKDNSIDAEPSAIKHQGESENGNVAPMPLETLKQSAVENTAHKPAVDGAAGSGNSSEAGSLTRSGSAVLTAMATSDGFNSFSASSVGPMLPPAFSASESGNLPPKLGSDELPVSSNSSESEDTSSR